MDSSLPPLSMCPKTSISVNTSKLPEGYGNLVGQSGFHFCVATGGSFRNCSFGSTPRISPKFFSDTNAHRHSRHRKSAAVFPISARLLEMFGNESVSLGTRRQFHSHGVERAQKPRLIHLVAQGVRRKGGSEAELSYSTRKSIWAPSINVSTVRPVRTNGRGRTETACFGKSNPPLSKITGSQFGRDRSGGLPRFRPRIWRHPNYSRSGR
jgi:hypothetical protein